MDRFIRNFFESYRYGEFGVIEPSKIRVEFKKFISNDKFWNALQSFHKEIKELID
jgi:hypothetical protein